MKGKFRLINVSIVALLIVFLLWLTNSQEKAFMESLLLHQPIEISQIETIHVWEKGAEMRKVPLDEYTDLVIWLNQYEPSRVSEEQVPTSDAQIVIETEAGATITIHHAAGKIFISRTDGKPEGISYVLLDDDRKIQRFFEEGF